MKFILLVFALAVGANALAPFHSAEEPIQGRYIVVLKDEVNVDFVASRFSQEAASLGLPAAIKNRFTRAINGFVAELDEEGLGLQLLRSLPEVNYVEEDAIVRASGVGSWGQDRIDQRNLPLDENMVITGSGKGTHIYIFDTGIKTDHPDFEGRASHAYNAISGEPDGDFNGHGTHCAGTAASKTYGVATSAQVYDVKVLGASGGGSLSGIIDGLNWLIENQAVKGKCVASLSLGAGTSDSLDDAIQETKNADIVVVVAAGNSNRNACNYSPARSDAAITVGASNEGDTLWYASNWGSCVDIFGPGQDIVSLSHTSNSVPYTTSGTSMACPHVAGMAAVHLGNGVSPAGVYTKIISDGTSGVLQGNIGTGSPNLLTYID